MKTAPTSSGAGKGIPSQLSEETFFFKEKEVKKEDGMESARLKRMFNEVDADVAFYKKMSEVYRAAEVAFKQNMDADIKAKDERKAAIATGLVVEEAKNA